MKSTPQNGFTLVEMAIVLLIVALLLGGLLPTISGQIEQRRTSETSKQLDGIKEALIGYAIINGRLPCPAQATLATGQSNAGREATIGNTCACNNLIPTVADDSVIKVACAGTTVTGVLPWATLGTNETDSWSNRFSYSVSGFFADSIQKNTLSTWTVNSAYSTGDCVTPTLPNSRYYQAQSDGSSGASQPSWPTVTGQTVLDNSITWFDMGNTSSQSTFALCSKGDMTIRVASGATTLASNIPAVIISHGKNGAGAYTQQGIPLPVGIDADEQENSDGGANNNYVSHTPTPTFDDLVVWISPNILLNRMVTAGKLP